MTYTGSEVALIAMLAFIVGAYLATEFCIWAAKKNRVQVAETPDSDPRGGRE